jgi:D-alanyl-D-alanine carboxypeptidase (penicillin-binding protein 5/6)
LNIKRTITALMVIMVLLVVQAVPVFAESDKPKTDCQAALLMDANTGKVLYEDNANAPMQPASLTKMMTALLVVEHLNLNDTVVITKEAANVGGNNIELKVGERFTVRELLNALLVYSANDTAVALGIAVSGNLDSFLALMNERAKQLGMYHTHYLSPNGLIESENHITTAHDIGIIARKVLQDPTLSRIVRKAKYTVPATNMSGERKLKSTNAMLYDDKTIIKVNGKERHPKYKGADGVKTGFMNASGYCIAAGARRHGMQLIAVVMHAKDNNGRYTNAIPMLDYGFANFTTHKLIDKGDHGGKVKVKYGHHTFVQTTIPDGAYVTLPKQASEDIADYDIVMKKNVKAPIRKGTKVGVVNIYENGKKQGTSDVVISESVQRGGPWTALYISDMAFIIMCVVAALILILLLVIVSRRRQIRKRREIRRRRAREKRAREIAAERAYKRRRDWPY